jgi:hypothetical protein
MEGTLSLASQVFTFSVFMVLVALVGYSITETIE